MRRKSAGPRGISFRLVVIARSGAAHLPPMALCLSPKARREADPSHPPGYPPQEKNRDDPKLPHHPGAGALSPLGGRRIAKERARVLQRLSAIRWQEVGACGILAQLKQDAALGSEGPARCTAFAAVSDWQTLRPRMSAGCADLGLCFSGWEMRSAGSPRGTGC
jgi:hypothetical protein